jgi:hypothetical protein
MKFTVGILYKNLSNESQFRENLLSDRHSPFKGVSLSFVKIFLVTGILHLRASEFRENLLSDRHIPFKGVSPSFVKICSVTGILRLTPSVNYETVFYILLDRYG